MQNYTNVRVVVIDDASNDGTGEEVQKVLENSPTWKNRAVVVRNKERKYAMANLRRAAKEFCKPTDIFMVVDGDDELLGRQVLKLFNSVFQKEKVWFVYSNFMVNIGVGYSRPFL